MKIITTPDPRLRQIAKPIVFWDKKLEKEIAEMITLLKAAKDPEGVGLAATQVGLDRRLFVISDKSITVFINPVILSSSKTMLSNKIEAKKRYLEGCLSVPELWGFVDRPYSITVSYQEPVTLNQITKTFTNFQSSYFQHELDHLDGILFTDRIIAQKGEILKETKNGLVPLKL